MGSAYAQVKYKYRKLGTNSWTGTGWGGYVASQSESLVMQTLRKKHSGCEIELVSINWK